VAPGPVASSLETDEVALRAGAVAAPLAEGTMLRLAFTLPFNDSSGLASFLAARSAAGSWVDPQFLSYATFERDFRPLASSVAAVERALSGAGATSVTLAPGGVTVDATLAAGAVENLLGVRFLAFPASSPGLDYTAVGEPRLPSGLAGRVSGIDGLSGATPGRTLVATTERLASPLTAAGTEQFVLGNDGSDWYLGSDYAQAYGATDLLPGSHSVAHATYPRGVAIATLLASGYNATSATVLPPWTPSVVNAYFNDTLAPSWPHPTVTGVPVNETGAPPPPLPGSFHGLNDSTGYAIENSLDLEMAGSLAPGASLYNFYFSGELAVGPGTAFSVTQYLADDLGSALAYNYGTSHLAVVSCSFGLNDLNSSAWDAQLEVAAATGVTVVAASGDQGNAPSELTGRPDDQWPLWPATAAFNTSGAISVGGVSARLSGKATATYTSPPLVVAYDPNVTGLGSVAAWWDTDEGVGHYAGTEGGTSVLYGEPSWQYRSAAQWPIVNATEIEGFGQLGRAGPDVAFPANDTIAFVAAAPNGDPLAELLGGTSVAAPVFAGLLADVVAVENATAGGVTGLGFLDPELYRIASFYWTHPGSSDPFLDVVAGANAVFSAAPGWDATTGWGGLSAPLLLAALENSTVANYVYTGPTPGLPTTTGTSGSALSPILLLTIAGLVGVAVVVAAVVTLSRRSRRRPSALPPVAPYRLLPYPAGPVLPPTGPHTTSYCAFCGQERLAEPGYCPSCGAR
jgi:subtilase family serine protease